MKPKILIDGLCFGEGPRWRENALWLSDMHAQQVIRAAPGGAFEIILTMSDDQPSGLGWLPDGRLIIVSMRKRHLLSWDGKETSRYADLSHLASWHCNDMTIDAAGNAYVGNFGFDLHNDATPKPAEIICVDSQGTGRIVEDNVLFPNGMVITPDGKTLIVGETFGSRLTAFDIKANGDLTGKRTWAELSDGAVPDGICLDEAGGIWSASPTTNECIRQVEGGEVSHRIATDQSAFACMIGNNELYVLTSSSSVPEDCRDKKDARVEIYPAPFGHAGLP